MLEELVRDKDHIIILYIYQEGNELEICLIDQAVIILGNIDARVLNEQL